MDSEISIHKGGGVTYAGPDATNLFRAKMLRASIRMHRDCGMIPTRGVTITKMFAIAGQYSGKKYKRGQHDAAIADLDLWINAMIAALPVKTEE
jgi:hypothetical protein